MLERFQKVLIPETCLDVDEQMMPPKGGSGLKRYLPKKPKKWGINSRYQLVYRAQVDGENEKKGPSTTYDAP